MENRLNKLINIGVTNRNNNIAIFQHYVQNKT